MNQSEKLDLILRELYKYRFDGKYYSIDSIVKTLNIPLQTTECNTLGHKLENDGFIKAIFSATDCHAEISPKGVAYCEREGDSVTFSGQSSVTNNFNQITNNLQNSNNANVVTQSENVTINQSKTEVDNAIEMIRKTISETKDIVESKKLEILECLDEIQENVKNNKKSKFSILSLLNLIGNISSVSAWATTLGQFAGIIPK